MRIRLSPQQTDSAWLTLEKRGDALTINGMELDFGPLPDGGTLPFEAINHPLVIGEVSRIGGHVEISILYRQPSTASEAERFPELLDDPADGLLVKNGALQND